MNGKFVPEMPQGGSCVSRGGWTAFCVQVLLAWCSPSTRHLDTFPAGESNRRESECGKVGEMLAWVWRHRETHGEHRFSLCL